jgi:hypothetical protein
MSAARQGHRATFLGNAAEGWLQRTGGLQKALSGELAPQLPFPGVSEASPGRECAADRTLACPRGSGHFSAETTRRRIH